jgi:hypothetical protein
MAVHTHGYATPLADVRAAHPRASIIRYTPNGCYVFDKLADAKFHETTRYTPSVR